MLLQAAFRYHWSGACYNINILQFYVRNSHKQSFIDQKMVQKNRWAGKLKISKTNGPGQVEIEIVPEDQGQEGKMKMKNCETAQHPSLIWTLLSDVDCWSLNNPTRKQKQQQQIVSEKF